MSLVRRLSSLVTGTNTAEDSTATNLQGLANSSRIAQSGVPTVQPSATQQLAGLLAGPLAVGGNVAASLADRSTTGPAPGFVDRRGVTPVGGPFSMAEPIPGLDREVLAQVQLACVDVVSKEQPDLADAALQHLPLLLLQSALQNVRIPNQIAYILATAEHESGFGHPEYERSTPFEEDHNPFVQDAKTGEWSIGGKSQSNHVTHEQQTAGSSEQLEKDYWNAAYGNKLGNDPKTDDGFDFRGRGFTQLTGRDNYAKLSNRLNELGFIYEIDGKKWGTHDNPIDLTAHPDHVSRVPSLGARIQVVGMTEGLFAPRAGPLSDYINMDHTDYKNARKTVNGNDEASLIASYARRYQPALAEWRKVFVARDAARDPAPAGP